MTYSINIIAPCIYQYENSIDFSNKIIDLVKQDSRNWKINNQNATDWQLGNKILGYDEYPVSFNFTADEHFLIMAKKIFDCVSDYATKNLTAVEGFDSCIIRKYSSSPGFLELESSDVENALRKVTAVLFLTDLQDGGSITFKNFDLTINPVAGSIVIFPSSFAYSFKINKPKGTDNFVVISHFV